MEAVRVRRVACIRVRRRVPDLDRVSDRRLQDADRGGRHGGGGGVRRRRDQPRPRRAPVVRSPRGGLGEVIWSWYEVVQGVPVPNPSAADAGFLLEIPLAIAGILALTSAPSRMPTRGEAVLPGAAGALPLPFVGWSPGLAAVSHASRH